MAEFLLRRPIQLPCNRWESLQARSTINIPGCPPHPDWIVWTIANLLLGTVGELETRDVPSGCIPNRFMNCAPGKKLETR